MTIFKYYFFASLPLTVWRVFSHHKLGILVQCFPLKCWNLGEFYPVMGYGLCYNELQSWTLAFEKVFLDILDNDSLI